MATVTVGNIVVNGVVLSITDEIGAGNPHESIELFIDWLQQSGFEQAAVRPAAPAQASPGPSQGGGQSRAYAGGGGGYNRGGNGGNGGNGNRGYGGGGGYQAGNRGGGGNGGNGYNRGGGGGGGGGGNGNANAGGWECSLHGAQNIRPSFGGDGFECKVFSQQQEDWTKNKPWIGRDGDALFYCREHS